MILTLKWSLDFYVRVEASLFDTCESQVDFLFIVGRTGWEAFCFDGGFYGAMMIEKDRYGDFYSFQD